MCIMRANTCESHDTSKLRARYTPFFFFFFLFFCSFLSRRPENVILEGARVFPRVLAKFGTATRVNYVSSVNTVSNARRRAPRSNVRARARSNRLHMLI